MNQFDRLFTESGVSLDRLRSFLEVEEAGNSARAAKSDPTRRSQFSRQVKDLEGFFGVALTRRVGRRIEITEEGHKLAAVIRRRFSELDETFVNPWLADPSVCVQGHLRASWSGR